MTLRDLPAHEKAWLAARWAGRVRSRGSAVRGGRCGDWPAGWSAQAAGAAAGRRVLAKRVENSCRRPSRPRCMHRITCITRLVGRGSIRRPVGSAEIAPKQTAKSVGDVRHADDTGGGEPPPAARTDRAAGAAQPRRRCVCSRASRGCWTGVRGARSVGIGQSVIMACYLPANELFRA